jgi:hypothetical protein
LIVGERLPRSVRYERVLGPFFSTAGLTNWTLHLALDEIVCVSLGVRLSIKAAILAGVSQIPGVADGACSAHPCSSVAGVLADDGSPRWRRYRIVDLDAIVLKRCVFTANEIRITRRGEKAHVYGIGDRPYTEDCRAVFAALYPGLYREKGL